MHITGTAKKVIKPIAGAKNKPNKIQNPKNSIGVENKSKLRIDIHSPIKFDNSLIVA